MKKMIFFVLLAAAFVSAAYSMGKRGDGRIVKSERALSPFDSLRIYGSAEVFFHESEEYRAVIEIDSNLEDYVELSARGRELYVGTRRGRHMNPTKFTVDIYCPPPDGVKISGSGSFTAAGEVNVRNFRAGISGSGKISGSFQCEDFYLSTAGSGAASAVITCDSFYANISGSGRMGVSGSAKDASIDISGSGIFDGGGFKVKEAEARVSGSGEIRIWAEEKLDADISGSGGVVYRGNPKIDYRGSGSGSIKSE